MFVVKKL